MDVIIYSMVPALRKDEPHNSHFTFAWREDTLITSQRHVDCLCNSSFDLITRKTQKLYLPFVRISHWWPVVFPHREPVMQIVFPTSLCTPLSRRRRNITSFFQQRLSHTRDLVTPGMRYHWNYRKTSNTSRTNSQSLNVSCILAQLSSLNPFKPGVKLRMKV